MATYFMLGRYTAEAVKGISPERTGKADALIKKFGGKITTGFILLGAYDLVLLADLPGNDQAVQFSLAMNKMTGISFETCPAITLAEFDRLAAAT